MKRILVVNSKGGCGKTTLATNLASHFAVQGKRVALADADRQKSALGWLKRRVKAGHGDAPPLNFVEGLNWSKPEKIDTEANGREVIVIDGPGGLRSDWAKTLIGEATHILVPVLPSVFDWEASVRFLDKITEIRRVRKGKAGISIVANRVRPGSRLAVDLSEKLDAKGYPLLCSLSDRVIYARCAMEGKGIFDRSSGADAALRQQWKPLLKSLK